MNKAPYAHIQNYSIQMDPERSNRKTKIKGTVYKCKVCIGINCNNLIKVVFQQAWVSREYE